MTFTKDGLESPVALKSKSEHPTSICYFSFNSVLFSLSILLTLDRHFILDYCNFSPSQGVRVQVRSVYVDGRSQPLKEQYFFAYRIRITNNSSRPVQLLKRHWIITDAKGKTEHVWGSGVIGEQPVILPDTHFEYTSACPLRTSSGRMEGDFEMKHIDKASTSTFNVAIAPFSLSTLGDGTDSL
ncbi:hypothetical protein LIER_28214 [Lithospermum erythrorhizon]|uniref:ApaG domain-containing protein n=1 Tax=Lithospermum erythrorhizon TaxID=34254 RepID=A0AAV3REY6_LITER